MSAASLRGKRAPTVADSVMSPEVEAWKAVIRSSIANHTRFIHGLWLKPHQILWASVLEDPSGESRVIIVAPPKYGKSPFVGLDYLGYRIGNDYEHYHCIYVSNTARQSNRNSTALRDTIANNPRYKFLYGIEPDFNKGWGENEWYVKRADQSDKDPTLQACGVFGPVLGATVQEIVMDDVADEENMATAYQREKLMDWIQTTLMSRLVPGGRAIMICCMVGDTPVTMADGSEKMLRDIRPGDMVLAWKDGRQVNRRVLNWAEQGEDEVFEVKTGHSTFQANARHPFMVKAPDKSVTWKCVSDLRRGDRIVMGGQWNGNESAILTAQQAWLLGFMFGDGWVTKRSGRNYDRLRDKYYPRHGYVACVATDKDETLNTRIVRAFRDCFDVEPKLTRHGYFRTEVARIGRWFLDHGLNGNAKTKRLPNFLFSEPVFIREAFIDGYVEADGHAEMGGVHVGRVSVSTASPGLARDIRQLGRSCGLLVSNINVSSRINQAPNSPVAKSATLYQLAWNPWSRRHSPFVESAVRSIKSVGIKTVYDLQVEDAECFFADRAVSHNTRWHEEDPAAVFEKAGWKTIKLAAIDDHGQSTYPEYWTVENLMKRKSDSDMGTRKFELMFQGNVLPEGGSIFKHEWWQYWENGKAPWQLAGDLKQEIAAVVQTWDTAFKGKQENDWSACETWAIVPGGYYLLNAWRAKMSFPQLKVAFVQVYRQFDARFVLIEDAASGQDLIAEMKYTTTIPIVAIQVDRDKVARANAVTPMMETGKIYLPKDAGWLHEWEYEHEVFPSGKNDDWVDCTTQFLNWARTHVMTGPSTPTEVTSRSRWR